MSRTARLLGITCSLLVYYGIPFRARRLRRFYSEFVCPGSLCFDIGAHTGNRVRCCRALGARVVAVEPQPDFARILRLLYGRDPGVTLVEAAVGAAPGAARLLASERTPTVTTLSREWLEEVEGTPEFRGVRWRDAHPFQARRLAGASPSMQRRSVGAGRCSELQGGEGPSSSV